MKRSGEVGRIWNGQTFVAARLRLTFCGRQAEERTSKKESLKWFAPRWSFAPQLWRQLNAVLSAGAIARIVALSIFIGVPIVVGLKLAIPGIVIPQLWKVLLILPGVVLYLLFYITVLTVIPQRIVIRRDKIIVEHSQKRVIDSSSVSKIWFYVHPSNRIRLKVRYRTNGGHRTRTIGVASHINLDQLCSLLPRTRRRNSVLCHRHNKDTRQS